MTARPAPPGGPLDSPPVDLPPIDRILPHRYPFLLVDRIVALDPGRRIVGLKRVAHGEPFLSPDNPPVVPPVMIIEAVAQVGAVLVLSMPDHRHKIAVVLGMDRIRSRKAVRAGDTMDIEVVLQRMKGAMGKMSGRVRVGRRVVAAGSVTFAVVAKPEPGTV